MSKKYLPIIIVVFIFGILVGAISIYYFTKPEENTNNNNPGTTINNNNEDDDNGLDLPTEGNDTVLTINSYTTLRVVNEYDKNFFTAKKNLLIMFASWCPNCQAEISEIEKILNHYENVKDVNVILIAHEYEGTVTNLIDLLENDVDFGDVEVKIDLKRIIRKTIDPTASTIPISYVVDKNGEILEIFNDSLTLEKAIEMVGK